MKKNNPPKKLRLFKKTIAHLNNEQMYVARGGGDPQTRWGCITKSSDPTLDCTTEYCVDDDKLTKDCA